MNRNAGGLLLACRLSLVIALSAQLPFAVRVDAGTARSTSGAPADGRKPLCALPLLPDYPYGNPFIYASAQLRLSLEKDPAGNDQVATVLSRERNWSRILNAVFFKSQADGSSRTPLNRTSSQNDPRLRSAVTESDALILSGLLQFHTYAVAKLLLARPALVKDLFPRANLEMLRRVLARVDTDLATMRLELDPGGKTPSVVASAEMIRAVYYYALRSHVDISQERAVTDFYNALEDRSHRSADLLQEALSGHLIEKREEGTEGWTNQVFCGCSQIINKLTGDKFYVVGMSAVTTAKGGGRQVVLTGILPEDISKPAAGTSLIPGPPTGRSLSGTVAKDGRSVAVTGLPATDGQISSLHSNFYLMNRMVAILWFQIGHELGHLALGESATEADCDAFGVLPFEIAQGPIYYVAAAVYKERNGTPPFPPAPVSLVYAPFRFAQPSSPAAGSLHDVWGSMPVLKNSVHGTWVEREKNVDRFSGNLYQYWLSRPSILVQ